MGTYKTRGEAIRSLRKNAGMSQEELAKRLDTTKQTIYKYETGVVTNIPSDRIEMIAKIFGVSPAVIMGWDEQPTPVYDVAAGAGRYNTGYPTDTYDGTLADGETISHVYGTSMEPTLQDGDLVVIRTQPFINYQRQIALVKIDGERDTLKRVEMREDGMALIPDNPDYPERFFTPEEVETLPVRVMGVVVRLIRNI